MIRPISNDHSADWHREMFLDFAVSKAAIGEPVPHMRVVDYLCRDWTDVEQTWLAGTYLAAYSVITGEVLAEYWPWGSMASATREGLERWLEEYWPGIHTRTPRRCVRTPRQMARCLLGFSEWARTDLPRLCAQKWATPTGEYDAWWRSANGIPYFGRYIAIRLLELMRRRGKMRAHLYDIRAVGAHSPIRCLMLLRPEMTEQLATGDAVVVNRVAASVKDQLREAGLDLSWFLFATLLCEYRSCYETGTDYAGNQHDEELEYSLGRHAEWWRQQGWVSRLYDARAAIDPHECLGEIQGWRSRRLDVASWMRKRGVVWSDLVYDYHASVAAGEPVRRQSCVPE